MADAFYPTIDSQFLEHEIIESGKIIPDSKVIVGKTTYFVLEGNKPLFKRNILLREISPGQINYEQATALAIKLSFIGKLMDWLEKNRDWKEGAYIVNPQAN